MKKIVAFLTAFVLLIVTIGGIRYGSYYIIEKNKSTYGVWSNPVKSTSYDAILKTLNKNTMVVFGSSEFQHGVDTIYHPNKVFSNTTFTPMLLGAGYHQSLNHAITLASLGDGLKNKKVVILLSPTWFRKHGVPDKAFASNFSHANYIEMLKNKNLSSNTKDYITKRTKELLTIDKKSKKKIAFYEETLGNPSPSLLDFINFKIFESFYKEKARVMVAGELLLEERKLQKQTLTTIKTMDFNLYEKQSLVDGKAHGDNPFYMENKAYKEIEKVKEKKKDKLRGKEHIYHRSKEYDDLRVFLKVCKEMQVEPLLVTLPVNGYWYAYQGAPFSTRKQFYENIQVIAKEYKVPLEDLSKDEDTKYFFEDSVHLSGKGWTTVNEILYNYSQKD